MSFSAPWWLLAGAVAAAVISVLHLLTRRDPSPQPLPTARFIPETPNRLVSRSVALSDRAVLGLRLLAILAATLAFAQPSFSRARRPLTQIILIDTSHTADSAQAEAAVRTLVRDHDRSIRFSSLSAGLIAAIREARSLRNETDSVSLAVVSPLARESFDAATAAVRATWPAGITWVPIEPVLPPPRPQMVALFADGEDPLRSTLASSGWTTSDTAPVRLVRTAVLGAADSTWVSEAGTVSRLLIHWPASATVDGDTVGAVATDRTVLVAAFLRSSRDLDGTARAWWVDGITAAADQPFGNGCIRRVEIPIDPAGDLALRQATRDLARDLLAPCGGRRDAEPIDSATIALVRGNAQTAWPVADLPALPTQERTVPWLLGLAVASLIAEQLLRRRSA